MRRVKTAAAVGSEFDEPVLARFAALCISSKEVRLLDITSVLREERGRKGAERP